MGKRNRIFISKIVVSLLLFTLIMLFLQKDKLNCFFTKYQLRYSKIELKQSDSLLFVVQFINKSNTKAFELSLIEIGANGCIPCKKMDTVLYEIAEIYKERVNIRFYNVTNNKGKKAAKYFGVNMIPVQVLIDKQGFEVFRHQGFYATKDLEKQINRIINQDK